VCGSTTENILSIVDPHTTPVPTVVMGLDWLPWIGHCKFQVVYDCELLRFPLSSFVFTCYTGHPAAMHRDKPVKILILIWRWWNVSHPVSRKTDLKFWSTTCNYEPLFIEGNKGIVFGRNRQPTDPSPALTRNIRRGGSVPIEATQRDGNHYLSLLVSPGSTIIVAKPRTCVLHYLSWGNLAP
jgi:hypothetical protein